MSFVAGIDNYPLMNPVDIEDIPKFPSLIVLPRAMIVILTVAVLRRRGARKPFIQIT